eukprot:m.480851 g.480851  ORF g.480851 m.480851 type:complete len:420 (-) comp21973_c0_seq1:131-1390(-)
MATEGDKAAAAAAGVQPPDPIVFDGVEFCVTKTEKRRDQAGEFIAYGLQTTAQAGNGAGLEEGATSVWRRFNEFLQLSRFLQHCHPQIVSPPLPEKKINFKLSKMAIDKFDEAFVHRRQAALNTFVGRLLAHPVLQKHKALHAFLTKSQWTNTLQVEVDGALHYWTPSLVDDVKSASASLRVRNLDRNLQEARNYADALQVNLTTLLSTHSRLAKREHEIRLQCDSYGAVLNEWSELEPVTSGLLRDIGLSFDSMVEPAKEILMAEDSKYAEPLKEYVFFTDSMRAVVQKHEQTRLDLERANANLKAREEEHSFALDPASEKGIRALWSSLTTTSDADREARVMVADAALKEAQTAHGAAEEADEEFVKQSVADIKRFHKQKVEDLKRIFAQYARSQEAHCRTNLQQWEEIRERCQRED